MNDICLPVIRVWFEVEFERPEALPRFVYSPLRGVLGSSLKQISCVARRFLTCLECPLNQHCAYGYLFETPKPEKTDRLKLYPYLPHPFALTPPHTVAFHSHAKIGLTLIGRAIQYFPHFVLAFETAGQRGLGRKRVRFRINKIIDYFSENELYQKGSLLPPRMFEGPFPQEEVGELELITLTPLSLRYQGQLIGPKDFEFHILVRNLLRRLSALSYFHVGRELWLDFKSLIQEASQIKIKEKDFASVEIIRYSARTKKKMPLRGLWGRVKFFGPLGPFLALLKWGELLHVGKNTSFGFGAYRIYDKDSSPKETPHS